MPETPENMVLVLLREMRSEIAAVRSEMGTLKVDMVSRFDKVDADIGSMKFQMTHILGAAAMSTINAHRTEEKADDAVTVHKRLDERRVRVLEGPARD